MMPRWLDGRTATELGNEIANDIRHLLPIEKGAKKPEESGEALAEAGANRREDERRSAQHRFNFYQKAKFANALRWSLKDAGYAPDFIEEVVGLILARM